MLLSNFTSTWSDRSLEVDVVPVLLVRVGSDPVIRRAYREEAGHLDGSAAIANWPPVVAEPSLIFGSEGRRPARWIEIIAFYCRRRLSARLGDEENRCQCRRDEERKPEGRSRHVRSRDVAEPDEPSSGRESRPGCDTPSVQEGGSLAGNESASVSSISDCLVRGRAGAAFGGVFSAPPGDGPRRTIAICRFPSKSP